MPRSWNRRRWGALITCAAGFVVITTAAALAWPSPPDGTREAIALADEMTRRPTPRPGEGGVRAGAMTYSRAFEGYALINVALEDPAKAAFAREKLDLLIEELLQAPISAGFGRDRIDVAGHALSPSVAFRGHLALLLAGRAPLGAVPPAQARLREALFDGLAREVLAAPNHLLPSYGEHTYPADNEVLAAAFAVAPDARRPIVHRAAGALQGSLRALEADGLPPSEVKPGTLQKKDVPRGCALSWTVGMRGLYAPERARALYARYRERYLVSYGPVIGFREWPPGTDRPADFDSGPIVMGVGTAASGIGLGAARVTGTGTDFDRLRASARLAGAGWIAGARRGHWLERAMWCWAMTARRWSGAASESSERPDAGTVPMSGR